MTKYYGFSFIISSIIYIALGFLFINFLDAKKPIPKPKEKIIKIAVIRPIIPKAITPPTPITPIVPPVIIPPQKMVSKPKHKQVVPKVVKKLKKKRIRKKRIKRKRIKKKKHIKKKRVKKRVIKKRVVKKKKVIKKRIIKKRVVKKKIKKHSVKKHIAKKHIAKKHIVKAKPVTREPEPRMEEIYYPPIIQEEIYTPPPVVQRVVPKAPPRQVYVAPAPPPPPPMPSPKRDNSGAKRVFLSQVRSQIINNKRYPKLALRRHIEGSVTVRFNINSSGDVSNIRFISGKTILQKAVRKAIIQSFPMGIPSNLRSELPINNVSVTVNFSIN